MSFSSANRTALLLVKETVWGTTPATPALQEMRYTGESLENSISTEKSKEIRSDRMLSDLQVVDSSPSGSFDFEMSASTFDLLIESALMGSWSAQLAIAGVAGDISTTTATGAANLSSTTAGKFTNVKLGQYVRLSGFTSAVNGFYQVIDKIDNQSLELFPVPGAAETPAGTAAKVDGSMLRNGVTEQSYTLIKEFNDTTVQTFRIFRGMRVTGMSLNMSTGSLLTGSFNFIGKSQEDTETAIVGATRVPTTSTEVMNCVSNIKNITQDGGAVGSDGSIMSLTLELDNQHREQKGIGVLGNVGVSAGTLSVTANASQYFEDLDQSTKFKNSTAFAFSYRLQDNAGNSYIITLPRSKYETFAASASGENSDIMAETSFAATRDPVTNCMIQIDRFSA